MTTSLNNATPNITLEGESVALKTFQNSHIYAPEYLDWLHDYEVVRTLNIPEYLEKQVEIKELETYCNRLISSQNDMFFAIHSKSDDKFIGTSKIAYINWYTQTADIGIMIGDKAHWRKGVGSQVIQLLCNFAFENLNLRKLTAGAMALNQSMIHIFHKHGFLTEGKIRQQDRLENLYVDHILLGCFKNEFR